MPLLICGPYRSTAATVVNLSTEEFENSNEFYAGFPLSRE